VLSLSGTRHTVGGLEASRGEAGIDCGTDGVVLLWAGDLPSRPMAGLRHADV